MLHVFVESNWVVDVLAPAHNKAPAALDLLRRAQAGEIQLHLPEICLVEARRPIHQDFQPRRSADLVRKFLAWGQASHLVKAEQATAARVCLDQLESAVANDLRSVDQELLRLAGLHGIETFPMNQRMLARSTELSFEGLNLTPYDQAILASVLIRAETLFRAGEQDLAFCELDNDLQPWYKDRHKERKDKLADLYDRASIWVYGDYLLETPPKPANWHK